MSLVDLSTLGSSGNAGGTAGEQATPLEVWKEQQYHELNNRIIAHGRNACEATRFTFAENTSSTIRG